MHKACLGYVATVYISKEGFVAYMVLNVHMYSIHESIDCQRAEPVVTHNNFSPNLKTGQ